MANDAAINSQHICCSTLHVIGAHDSRILFQSGDHVMPRKTSSNEVKRGHPYAPHVSETYIPCLSASRHQLDQRVRSEWGASIWVAGGLIWSPYAFCSHSSVISDLSSHYQDGRRRDLVGPLRWCSTFRLGNRRSRNFPSTSHIHMCKTGNDPITVFQYICRQF